MTAELKPLILSPEDIATLLAGTRNRGGHGVFVRDFLKSGDVYRVVNESPEYAGKSEDQLKTSVKQGLLTAHGKIKSENAETPEIRVIFNDGNLIMVNVTALATANAPTE